MDQQYEALENLQLQKSNSLVSAKYKSGLIENQIMAIALTRIEIAATRNSETPLRAKLYPGELKRLVGDPSNIYKTLKKVSKTMTGHTMFLEDGKGNFKAFSVVTNANYENGIFTVYFNQELRPHILSLTGNYTSYELSVLTGFSKNSSFRIYELLKSHLYKAKNEEGVKVEYNISELRFMIGLADSDAKNVRNALASMGKDIDWDELYEKLDKKDRKYESWYDLQRYVIKPAKEELEQKSNVRFDYKGIREGRKMGKILFVVYKNTPKNQDIIDERKNLLEKNQKINRQLELPMDIYLDLYEDYVGHNHLIKEDIDLLIEKAKGEKQLIIDAITSADEQPNIQNYMGWIIRYIENGGYKKTETITGSAKKAEEITELKKAVETEKDTIDEKLLKKIKTKEDYPEFLLAIQDKGITEQQLLVIYSAGEVVQMYADWKMGRQIQL